MSTKQTDIGVCALCGSTAPLLGSHVIPAFVFRWLRETSATGYFRFSETPNKRMQDGIKLPLLCSDCEALLNGFETPFANNVFHPLNKAPGLPVRYGDWLLKFCVSVSWRVLKLYEAKDGLETIADGHKALNSQAQEVWANFLLGKTPHPGRFEQHLLPFDAIESYSGGALPPNMNRYLLRAIDTDFVTGDRTAMTYAKLGRFAIFGFIEAPPGKWIGTKVHVRTGVLDTKEYKLPYSLVDFLADKARKTATAYEGMSDRQVEKIEDAVLGDIDRSANSETVRAMLHDERLFGTEAIVRKAKPTV